MEKQGQEQQVEFFFTDTEALSAERSNKKRKGPHNGLIPFPESLKGCDDHDVLFAWNLWFCLASMLRKKLKKAGEKNKGIRKNYQNGNKEGHTLSFGRAGGVITLAIKPWAARILGLSEIKIFPCPLYCPLGAYTEIIKEMNGGKI